MLTPDTDPQETAEWREAFMALAASQGSSRARYLLDELARLAREQRVGWKPELATPYVNTVGVNEQPVFPGDLALEERLASLMRWNALAMVVRANQAESGGSAELGGHIASYASAADLFETGFNHFFRARRQGGPAEPRRAAPSGESPPRGGSDSHEVEERGGNIWATWFFFSRTARPACMPAPTSKAG